MSSIFLIKKVLPFRPENHKTEAIQSKYLATIVRNVPLKIDFNKLKIGELDLSKVGTILKKYEFFSLYDRAEKLFSESNQNSNNKPDSDTNIQPILNTKYEIINDLGELQTLETTLLKTPFFSPILIMLLGIIYLLFTCFLS